MKTLRRVLGDRNLSESVRQEARDIVNRAHEEIERRKARDRKTRS